MMGGKYAVLFGLVFSALGCLPVFAAEYELTEESYTNVEGYSDYSQANVNSWLSLVPDDQLDFDEYQEIMEIMYPELSEDYEEGDLQDDLDDEYDISTASSATRSSASRSTAMTVNNVVSTASIYPSPDDGTISATYLQYFKDMLVKLPYGTKYVFFRVNNYEYRMVYGDAIEYSDGVFSGSDLNYIRYYRTSSSSIYKLESGYEGGFQLTTNGYLVYSNVGDLYPDMNGGVYSHALYACLFVLVVGFLFNLIRAFFYVGTYRIK